MTKGLLAITGGTGFVGTTLVRQALVDGWHVRALTRRTQSPQEGVEWVAGGLDAPEALDALVRGAEAVIHVAGVTNTPTREGFIAGNIIGTQAVVDATKRGGVSRFVHVSSLTAREPGMSNYGWSKAEAEQRVVASTLNWTIIRPPAIFGPGDVDHLDLFKAAQWRIMPMPPRGRISVIEVSDLARLLLALSATPDPDLRIYEADDGRPGGWTQIEYAHAIGAAVGKSVLALHTPAALVRLGARLDRLMRGQNAKLTADRAAYFCHPDWVIDPDKRPETALWMPEVETGFGLKATAKAYREAGWL